ncbi:hypothetical protein SAMN05444920_13160 [Nonomuraea solani]|uniref:Uncharacterized protein n=1 Tax=Nonomuraea solani TaxID=1144553 RepID=A0A1H6EYG7_9ACTN|nr:hypothetical protein SAMN05444920_13160 [Nonomuraea solani]
MNRHPWQDSDNSWTALPLVARVSRKVLRFWTLPGGWLTTVWACARVSTRDQNPQLQLDALATSGYDELATLRRLLDDGASVPEAARTLKEAVPPPT